ncbi:MAG: hypothetical protein FJZ43_04850 [Candidatus Staskawiczbacteria bacterium]|nr:hypothetical protein [Candidatus Staskawiczbacteria bacterium]
MPEYFLKGNTFAAPFFSDAISKYVTAETAEEALLSFIGNKNDIYAMNAYNSADDYHKGEDPVAIWHSNKLIAINEAIKGKGGYTLFSHDDHTIEIDGKTLNVDNPRGGKIVTK